MHLSTTTIVRNKRLNTVTTSWQEEAEKHFSETNEKVRRFEEFQYAAKSWRRSRRIIAKIEYTEKGSNTRYVVTNLEGKPQSLYDRLYCARGDMENRIKEQQLDLFADRTSCNRWWPNQFRLLFSSLLIFCWRPYGVLPCKVQSWRAFMSERYASN